MCSSACLIGFGHASHGCQRVDFNEELADKLRPDGEVSVEIDLHTEPSPEVSAMLYRCARETLANVFEHADADRVEIRMVSDETSVHLRVHDNGIGLPAQGIDKRYPYSWQVRRSEFDAALFANAVMR